MKIKVKTLKGENIEFEVNPTDSVESLKDKIEASQNQPKAWQKLIYSGKILLDNNTIGSYNIKEGEFLVLFVKPPKEGEKPAATPAPATPTPAQAPATPTPAPAPTTPTQTPASPTPAAQPTTPSGGGIAQGVEFEAMVTEIVGMGFPRDEVIRALNASFRNPERAVQYLLSGEVPEVDDVPSPASNPQSPGANVLIPPEVNILPGGAGGQEAPRQPGPFDFLRAHPQFATLRAMVQQNPQLLQPVLQQLAAANPQILQLINQHQDEFIRLLQEPVEEGDIGGGGGAPGGGPVPPPGMQYIQVTPAEKEAIDRLCGMGFDRAKVIEAFVACDKDELMAANYLVEHQFDEEDDDFGGN